MISFHGLSPYCFEVPNSGSCQILLPLQYVEIKCLRQNSRSHIIEKQNKLNVSLSCFVCVFLSSSGIPASALCAFDLSEIEQLFDESPFKDQETGNSLWLNVAASEVPDPRPGTVS